MLDRLLSTFTCPGCSACIGTGQCIQQDDMSALPVQMEDHSVWVLGTPIYWLGPTSVFKAFLDRWFAPWSGSSTKRLFEGRRAILVTSMESTKPGSAQPTIDMLTGTLSYLGVSEGQDAKAHALWNMLAYAANSALPRLRVCPWLMQSSSIDEHRRIVGKLSARRISEITSPRWFSGTLVAIVQ